ncbi:hypothetical protein GWI33_007431 [Rhynchophorus ferrugineus]|uniref:Uncharacterized protein n=1 Tax=Rhynchophorus ferrugineus TaxID=354439 RepID=A0A834MD24_RHYFE|nr:hypothetical protein GWI33_007431 [Rhynchophorus ferrugineus]
MLLITIFAVFNFLNLISGITFKYCKGSESNTDACLVDAISDALQKLRTGCEEFGLKNLDVYNVGPISVEAGNGAIHIIQNNWNIELRGIADAIVKEAHFDKESKALTFTMLIPRLIQNSDYNISGQVLSLPLSGIGTSTFELYDMGLKFYLILDEYTRDAKRYYKIKSMQADMPISGFKAHYDNLFDGNKVLGDSVNEMFNKEWKVIYDIVQHPVEKAYGKDFEIYIQTFLDHVPAKDLF